MRHTVLNISSSEEDTYFASCCIFSDLTHDYNFITTQEDLFRITLRTLTRECSDAVQGKTKLSITFYASVLFNLLKQQKS